MDAMPNLTNLLAAHGVYALTVIFIFYQQRPSEPVLSRQGRGVVDGIEIKVAGPLRGELLVPRFDIGS